MSDVGAVTYGRLQAAVPGTTKQFSQKVAGFMVGVSGTVALWVDTFTASYQSVTVQANAGVIYPLANYGVNSTGTTATGIVLLLDDSAKYVGAT